MCTTFFGTEEVLLLHKNRGEYHKLMMKRTVLVVCFSLGVAARTTSLPPQYKPSCLKVLIFSQAAHTAGEDGAATVLLDQLSRPRLSAAKCLTTLFLHQTLKCRPFLQLSTKTFKKIYTSPFWKKIVHTAM